MANTSRIKGFTVVKGNQSSPYTGRNTLYYVAAAADEILLGDVVKLSGSGSTDGVPGCDLCGATDVPIGIVTGIVNVKRDPSGKMSAGSLILDIPESTQIAAGSAGWVLVNDDPNVMLEVEVSNGSFAVTDIGLNASHANGTRTAATYTSPAYIDAGTEATTSTLNFNIRGFVQRPDNEVGASAKILVGFNRHQYKSVGTTGI